MACGPFRRCIFRMDSRKQTTCIHQTDRGNWRTCGGDDAEKVWGYARRALLVQPTWSWKPTYASKRRATACGPFRRCIFHMDSRKQKTSIYQTNRAFRTCGGDDAEKVWGHARRALLVQPAWSRKPTYASKSRAKLHAASMRAVSSPHPSHGQSEASDQQISN